MDQVRYELAQQAEAEKPKNEKLQRVKNVISTMLLLLVSGGVSAVLGYFFYHLDTPGGAVILFNMRIRFLPARHLEWRHAKGWTLLEGNLGTNFPSRVSHDISDKNATFMRVRWSNHAVLETDYWKADVGGGGGGGYGGGGGGLGGGIDIAEDDIQCYQFRWRAATCIHSALQDCYSLDGPHHWYGGGVMYGEQQWNMEKLDITMSPYLTGNRSADQPYGKILNRYWLSTSGVAIYVEPDSPLWVSINASGDNRLCLKAAYEDCPYWQPNAQTPVSLNYTMCAGPDMKSLHTYMSQTFFYFPSSPPSEKSLKLVSELTWFISPSDHSYGVVNVSFILRSLDQLKEVFDNFTQCKLVLNTDTLVFPEDVRKSSPRNDINRPLKNTSSLMTFTKGFITQLRSRGFMEVALALSPTDYLDRHLRRDFVQQIVFRDTEQSSIPPHITWETTEAQLVASTRAWFRAVVDRRKRHDDLGVASFVFRGGHALSLPLHDVLIKGLRTPDSFTSMFQTQALRRDAGALFDAASGYRLNLSSFLVMRERHWTWTGAAGLSGIIPEALTLGLVGFPLLVAPSLAWKGTSDNRGSREPHRQSADETPDDHYHEHRHSAGSIKTLPDLTTDEIEDLYLHWLQIITFFPSISFTLTSSPTLSQLNNPNNNLTQITSELLALRRTHHTRLLALARTAHREEDRAAILRPLWWLAPNDRQAQTIDDQYLVGANLLVAPVVGPRGAWTRSIYLPRGTWFDVLRNVTVVGPQWLQDYAVQPWQLAHFILGNGDS